MDRQNLIGKVAIAKAGRDAGKYFMIVDVVDNNYVYISDGMSRKIEKPKKKKIKHLSLTNIDAGDIKVSLMSKVKVSNPKIKRFLQSVEINKEV